MDKVEIITAELKKINIKYLGLSVDLRRALLSAMGKYTDQEIPFIQRFNKRLGTDGTNTGLEMVVRERIEMIEKHGKTVDFDVKHNTLNQLSEAASKLCDPNIEDFHGIEDGEPAGWDNELWNKMIDKVYSERLIVAGALIAAEIDRLQNA